MGQLKKSKPCHYEESRNCGTPRNDNSEVFQQFLYASQDDVNCNREVKAVGRR